MTKASVRLFEMKDLLHFTPSKELEGIEWRKNIEKNVEQKHWIVSFWYGEDVRCIIGAKTIYDGVGEIWQFNSNDIESCKFSLAKLMRRSLELVLAPCMGYHRIQGVCKPEGSFRRWAKFFGFEEEGTLKSFYKKGENMVLLARVF